MTLSLSRSATYSYIVPLTRNFLLYIFLREKYIFKNVLLRRIAEIDAFIKNIRKDSDL